MCVSQSSICCSFVVCLCQIFFFRNLSFLLRFQFEPKFLSSFSTFVFTFASVFDPRRNHYLFSGFGVRISGRKIPRLLQF